MRPNRRQAASVGLRIKLSARLRAFRKARYGDQGGPALARDLGIPARTLYNYETGVPVPWEVLVRLVEAADASPEWLLTGEGRMTRSDAPDSG